jgi:hypothetical protein
LAIAAAAVVAVVGSPGVSSAAFVTYIGSDSSGHSATAKFDLTGSVLSVTLTNTGTGTSNADVLQNLYFAASGVTNSTLTEGTATAGAGSVIRFNGGTVALGAQDVGGEFGAINNTSFTSNSLAFNYAIGSAGRGVLGSTDAPFSSTSTTILDSYVNPTPNSGVPPDGPTGGLVNGFTGNSNMAFIDNSVTFTYTVSGSFSLSQLTRVGFAYGTSTSDTFLTGTGGNVVNSVPAPAGLILAAGMVPFLGVLRRRLRAAA